MSLIAAVLSICQKTFGSLSGINSSIGGLVTTTNTINSNTQLAAQASATQTGLSNQGYSSGRAGNLDFLPNLNVAVSSRAANLATKPQVNGGGNGSGTVLNVGGPGILHGVALYPQGLGGGSVTIVLDGSTIATVNAPGFSVASSYVTPSGAGASQTSFSSATNGVVGMGGSLNWVFRSSCVITWAGNLSVQVVYAN